MSATTTYIRDETFIQRLVRRKLFWPLTLLVLFTYPLARSVMRQLPPPLPVLYSVPAFELTNQFGKPFGSKDLQGRPYIASFAFTNCPTICPKLMSTLQTVQKRVRGLGTNIAIVTFSVDPINDTPEALFKHARSLRASAHIWSFLTTDNEEQMRRLLIDGYKVPMDKSAGSLMDIAHTGKFLLVDHTGGVRGHYATDKPGIDKLMIDVGLLVNRENAP